MSLRQELDLGEIELAHGVPELEEEMAVCASASGEHEHREDSQMAEGVDED